MVDTPTIAKRWNFPNYRANNTVRFTTQRGVRHVANTSIMRRFPTNDRMLRYNRLPYPMFTNTLVAGTTSQRGHKFAQMFATSYGWFCTIPTTKKSDAPMTLLTMPSADITGDSNFGTILESKVCVSAVNTSIEKSSKLEASMTN